MKRVCRFLAFAGILTLLFAVSSSTWLVSFIHPASAIIHPDEIIDKSDDDVNHKPQDEVQGGKKDDKIDNKIDDEIEGKSPGRIQEIQYETPRQKAQREVWSEIRKKLENSLLENQYGIPWKDRQNASHNANDNVQPIFTAAELQTLLNRIYRKDGEKVAYLTFDDGPSPTVTPQILDILKAEGIKATFFVIGDEAARYPELVQRIYNEGHTVANHTQSHVFSRIYASPQNYLESLKQCEETLKSILGEGYRSWLTRFPGGSFGKKLEPYRAAVNEAGYAYVDWNCVNGDAEGRHLSAKQLIQRLKQTAAGQEHLVILMHDAAVKQTTADTLPEIIQYLKGQGYSFRLLPQGQTSAASAVYV
jgi:peptidoglycan/xylan/chitin deacetylase (PgdA/CDA1 family)